MDRGRWTWAVILLLAGAGCVNAPAGEQDADLRSQALPADAPAEDVPTPLETGDPPTNGSLPILLEVVRNDGKVVPVPVPREACPVWLQQELPVHSVVEATTHVRLEFVLDGGGAQFQTHIDDPDKEFSERVIVDGYGPSPLVLDADEAKLDGAKSMEIYVWLCDGPPIESSYEYAISFFQDGIPANYSAFS